MQHKKLLIGRSRDNPLFYALQCNIKNFTRVVRARGRQPSVGNLRQRRNVSSQDAFYYLATLFHVFLRPSTVAKPRHEGGRETNDCSADCNCRFRSRLFILRGLGRVGRFVVVCR
jgi:hypothetical protein